MKAKKRIRPQMKINKRIRSHWKVKHPKGFKTTSRYRCAHVVTLLPAGPELRPVSKAMGVAIEYNGWVHLITVDLFLTKEDIRARRELFRDCRFICMGADSYGQLTFELIIDDIDWWWKNRGIIESKNADPCRQVGPVAEQATEN